MSSFLNFAFLGEAKDANLLDFGGKAFLVDFAKGEWRRLQFSSFSNEYLYWTFEGKLFGGDAMASLCIPLANHWRCWFGKCIRALLQLVS